MKVPALSSATDTKLYVYYGNAAADDQQDTDDVWDADYRMVQHLKEAPANGIVAGHADSTTNGMDGMADRFYGASTTDAQGKIGGADIFKDTVYVRSYWYDPVNYFSRVNLPATLLGSQESFTISAWMKSNADGAVISNNGGEVDYCTISGYAYYAYYLQRVVFNTINNSSTTYSGSAYTDYTNISTTVQAGQTYTLTTTNAPYMHHAIKVWFDYNQDGDFADTGEELLVTAESSYQIGHSISVTIPTTALNGATRMRVRARYNGYSWGGGDRPNMCGYNDYSEAEDYTVVIAGSEFNKADNAFTLGSFDTGKFSIIKDNVTYDTLGSADLNDGLWHHLTATYGAEGMKLYVDGNLEGTNSTLTGNLAPLRSGFWIGRYIDDRNGRYGFDGTIDEVRVSTSERDAGWIRTEYNNQNAPDSFFTLAEGEARIMDHFALAADETEVFIDDPLTLTIRAINNMGELFAPYSGERTLVFSGAATGSESPTATDKHGNRIVFGTDTVLEFLNGVASTTLHLYQDETAQIEVVEGSYSAAAALPIIVKSRSAAFIPPSRPSIADVAIKQESGRIDFDNLPEGIMQMAVSATGDFGSASWEDFSTKDDILARFKEEAEIYVKFRTNQGAVSDVLTIKSEAVPAWQDIQNGYIIQCRNSSDPNAVHIVKPAGEKKFIRHIVSLEIFNYYAHLKWENLIQVETLDGYSLSGWVRVNTGANGTPGPNDKVWEINGDQTRHWIDMTAEEFLQHGGSEEAIYSINQGELELYEEGSAVHAI